MQTLAADQAALQMLPMNLELQNALQVALIDVKPSILFELCHFCRAIASCLLRNDVHIVAPQPLHAEHKGHADISNNEGDLAHNTRAQLYMNLARNFARHLAPIWERNFGGLNCYYRQV